MSKKKSFTGSTMTLKDFHGGSIPSDLPLPSAPGISAAHPSSSAADHHRWAPPPTSLIGSHTRTRPGSASTRSLDATPFLSTLPNIGRHFDEDERKPFDANAGFVRRAPPDPVVTPANVSTRPVTLTRSDPKPKPAVGSSSAAGPPNAWGVRREKEAVVVSAVAADPVVSCGGGGGSSSSLAVLTSRFAQASAIDKISSGRWQSKLVKAQQEVEVEEEEEAKVVDLGERPKLKILPRTRGGDVSEGRGIEQKQV